MDLELCTGDPLTYPFSEYCSCDQEIDEYEIPYRFYSVIPEIADSMNAGFICYLNPETLEVEDIPKSMVDDPEEFEMTTGVSIEDEELLHLEWDRCFVFEPLNSDESLRIMEEFADEMEDERFQEKLFYALNHRKPFARFKALLKSSKYRKA